MISCKALQFNFLAKKVNCLFLLNQMLHMNQAMVNTRLQSSGQTLALHKHLSSSPLLSKPVTSWSKCRVTHNLTTPETTFSNLVTHQSFSTHENICQFPNQKIHHTGSDQIKNRLHSLTRAGKLQGAPMSTQVPPASRVDAPSHMVWVDCEMTGLEPPGDVILEVACLITDADLKVVDQTEIVVHRSEEVLQNMNEWCVEHHNASGLTDRVRASSVSIEEADRRLHQFVAKYVKPKTAPMVGNSVYMDRLFIMRELPLFNNHLHYRIIDVSSLKELCKMYNPELYKKLPPKRLKHRGLEDIQDTLEEFKFYKRHFLHTAASLVEFPSAVPYC